MVQLHKFQNLLMVTAAILICSVPNICVKCDNILFITYPIYSLIRPIKPAIDELFYKYGHRSTVIMSSTLAENEMIKNSTIDVITLKSLNEADTPAFNMSKIIENLSIGKSYYDLEYVKLLKESCELFLSDQQLFRQLHKRHFKFAVVSNEALGMCFNIIPYKLSIPFMHFGYNYDPVNERIPYSASFVPAAPILDLSDKMSFLERCLNFIYFCAFTVVQDVSASWFVVYKYASEKPYISTIDLWKQAEFHLLILDPVIDYPRPVFQNYDFIGGIGTKPAKPLDDVLNTFMSSANDGAIIVSFGSLAAGFPEHIIHKLLVGFSRFPSLKFVFKHDNHSLSTNQTLTFPWIPQNDLLGHKNTKLFITHCGSGGQFEALYHGIPMLGFPLFQEQHVNARRASEKGFGINMKIYEFTIDELVHNIKELITNKSYKQAITRASEIFRSRPDTPDQRMAYWINHVMKYGGGYMRPASLDVPLYKYFMLDVALFISAVIILCVRFTCFVLTNITKLRIKTKVD